MNLIPNNSNYNVTIEMKISHHRKCYFIKNAKMPDNYINSYRALLICSFKSLRVYERRDFFRKKITTYVYVQLLISFYVLH